MVGPGCLPAFAALLLFFMTPHQAAAASYDLIIRNGHIIDGTGSPWYGADVAVRDGHIAAIGRLANASATTVIDAHGQIVAPGFIDMLGQSELTLLVDPRAPSKIFQGITTEITGEGESVAPLNDTMIRQNQPGYDHYHLKVDWRTLPEYFARLERQGMARSRKLRRVMLASMPLTCAARARVRWPRWTRPFASAAKRGFPSKYSI